MNKASIIVTRYKESDEMVKKCLTSLANLSGVDVAIYFLDQKTNIEPALIDKISRLPNSKLSRIEIPAKSLSYARNFGINLSSTDYVIFCDIDCILPTNWAKEIVHTLEETKGAIIGTKIIPVWSTRPSWYHQSRFIKEFYSMIDISQKIIPITKVVGASFAINKRLLGDDAYFDENLGRANGNLLGGEETDLCDRAMQKGLSIYYTPNTYAEHTVEKERISLTWLIKRAYSGGYSRAKKGGKVSTFNDKPKAIDYAALTVIAIPYLLGRIMAKIKI